MRWVNAFNPGTGEAEISVSSKPPWSTELVPGQTELHKEALSKTPFKKKIEVESN